MDEMRDEMEDELEDVPPGLEGALAETETEDESEEPELFMGEDDEDDLLGIKTKDEEDPLSHGFGIEEPEI